MAVFRPHTVRCACGAQFTAHLADSINVRRAPEVRQRILRGELHRASCPSCRREVTIEKTFYYTDLDRGALFKVLPRGERHTWREASATLSRAAQFVREGLPDENEPALRVVFGMDELREKLVAQDANIDDRDVERMKVMLIADHPILVRRPRLRLILNRVEHGDFVFSAYYEHDTKRFEVRLPEEQAGDFRASHALRDWSGRIHTRAVDAIADHWVSIWRGSPQPSALSALKQYGKQLDSGARLDTASPAFLSMLDGLPRGSHLPAWAKRELQKIFNYVRDNGPAALQDKLFEIRFGIELEDDWSVNRDNTDIAMLWNILRDLPDSNVEGNTKIHEILLDKGGGGAYEFGSHDISIGAGELADSERFEDVVRHEVGHALHEKKEALVEGWLQHTFGWRTFEIDTDAGIDEWVGLMGGWGTLDAQQKRDCRTALRTALGPGGRWNAGPTPHLPQAHPWNAPGFGPRVAFEKTGSNWFLNYETWHRAQGKAFYLNYWYRTLIAVDTTTLDLVAKMPDPYAAMSHFEFFAELYALYFNLESPKRGNIPDSVMAWLAKNVGKPSTKAPVRPPEMIVR